MKSLKTSVQSTLNKVHAEIRDSLVLLEKHRELLKKRKSETLKSIDKLIGTHEKGKPEIKNLELDLRKIRKMVNEFPDHGDDLRQKPRRK